MKLPKFQNNHYSDGFRAIEQLGERLEKTKNFQTINTNFILAIANDIEHIINSVGYNDQSLKNVLIKESNFNEYLNLNAKRDRMNNDEKMDFFKTIGRFLESDKTWDRMELVIKSPISRVFPLMCSIGRICQSITKRKNKCKLK